MIDYKKFDSAMPYCVVHGVVYSHSLDAFLTLRRSKTVRSAAGVWSMVTGLHEVGQLLQDSMVRELKEEVDLVVDARTVIPIGVYENLRTEEDSWHWVHHMMLVPIVGADYKNLKNNEPDKHESLTWVSAKVLVATEKNWNDYLANSPFTREFEAWFTQHRVMIYKRLCLLNDLAKG